ncbi:MAG: ferrochelatase [Thermoguttaceae bacterium]|nr:ferrochelatase [Thermoguttaceae bacterium]MDW8078658.1 ferrochelatase [Thermoguttaceae bacterium]
MTAGGQACQALLVLSVGGPESPADVWPFLERLAEGKKISHERLVAAAARYEALGGRSPHNAEVRALLVALAETLAREGPSLAIYWANKYWFPSIEEVLAQMVEEGIEHAAAIVLTPFGSYAGCRAYVEAINKAKIKFGQKAPTVAKLRLFYNHPLFVEAVADRLREALREARENGAEGVRVAFSAHSLPRWQAEVSPYVRQFAASSEWVAKAGNVDNYTLVYQSRSGDPGDPWLEPDVKDWLSELAGEGFRGTAVVVPIGFVVENMETVYDLDIAARQRAEELGINLVRAGTVGCHRAFVGMIRELVLEYMDPSRPRRALGPEGPWPEICPPRCCLAASMESGRR